jgi:hypothetical protein
MGRNYKMAKTAETVFQPEPRPRVLKTNIKNIAKYITQRINDLGFDVYISCSSKSKSRYLEFYLRKGYKKIVRISDHPASRDNRWKYAFDIHTTQRRHGSIDYIEFLDALKLIIGTKRQKAVSNNPDDNSGKE